MNRFRVLILITIFCSCKKIELKNIEFSNFTIQSEETNSEFLIKTASKKGLIPSKHTKILYLLDAEWYFDDVLNQIFNSDNYLDKDVILIGIEKGRGRKTDYTPSATSQGYGGAFEFFLFIEKELIAELNQRFNYYFERQNNSIIGHSLGGLAVSYAFTSYNHLFENYLALSPSNWYDNGIILSLEQSNTNIINLSNGTFFLSIAELEVTQTYNRLFYERIKNTYSNYFIEKYVIKKKDHSSGAKRSVEKAIQFFLTNA